MVTSTIKGVASLAMLIGSFGTSSAFKPAASAAAKAASKAAMSKFGANLLKK